MAHVALRLSVHLSDVTLEDLGARVLAGHVAPALASPLGLSHALAAMDRLVRGPTEIYVVGDENDEGTREMLAVARAAWQPNAVLARVAPQSSRPSIEGKKQIGGRATAYVCRDRTCGVPMTNAAALAKALTP
jgi:uncharacterized protein YyaL (SSP411 family)